VPCEPLNIEDAEAHYQHALALADELGMRPPMAHCHHGLGTLYAKTAQREQAGPELAASPSRSLDPLRVSETRHDHIEMVRLVKEEKLDPEGDIHVPKEGMAPNSLGVCL